MRAAEYVRMSTDHQRYSIDNQSEANRIYAATRGMEIVRTYADEGISGLSFDKRDALKRLINDVQSGGADFEAILVYDVSRWGRFQDSDESGYYEYICKRSGVSVHYCAEQFENDGSPFSAIVKSIKRAMAGEYSRELSVKVFEAQRRVVRLGFRLGGQPGYGLRRRVVTENGVVRGLLAPGEWKMIGRDRVVLIHGPQEEVDTVRWIYAAFVHKGKTEFQIAQILTKRGVANGHGRPRHTIKRILKSEKYIGNNVWNRTSLKLQQALVYNTPDAWVRADGVFEPVIAKSLFDAAQSIYRERMKHPINGRSRHYSDDEMLARLRRVLQRRGHLSSNIIDESRGIQSVGAYEARFGSLTEAYRLIGYTQHPRKRRRIRSHRSPRLSDEQMLDKLRQLLRRQGNLSNVIIDSAATIPSRAAYETRFGGLKRAYALIGFAPDPFRQHSPRPHGLSDEQMLDVLKGLWQEHGYVRQSMITKDISLPSVYAYEARFGGLLRAYELIGFVPKHCRKRRGNNLRHR